jgi:FMN phosphatase YigB (HAD superfamily)
LKWRKILTLPTVLLDLDNTLLGNDMKEFLPPYFALLHKHFQDFIDAQTLWQITLSSVQTIHAQPNDTDNKVEAFIIEFSRRIGQPLDTVQQAWDTFYRDDFPQLKAYTTHRPEAKAVVSRLLADGHQVVIATNPLFPAEAIKQRMKWAGVNGFSYALVTTMENSRYFKPDLQYYQEILTKVGSTPQTTWMVGDDPVNDIEPAHSLGISTWWITPDGPSSQTSPPQSDRQGSLSDLLAWIESGGLNRR